MPSRRKLPVLAFIGLMVMVVSGYATAQRGGQSDSCPLFVEEAVAQLEDQCSDMSRNSACYGYFQVGATLTEELAADTFSEPSDRIELTSLPNITTAPYDEVEEKWGVAVLSVQAGDGIPDSQDGCPRGPNDPHGEPCSPDEDGDGWDDWSDSCPYEPGEVNRCPE